MQFIKFLLIFIVLVQSLYAAVDSKVTLRLQWKHQFEFAGFYAAKELGYYKDAGLDVEIYEYDTNIDIVQEILQGEKDFAVWGSGVIEQAMNGKPLMFLANYFKRSPLAILTHPDVLLPSELKGKSLMIPTSDFNSANYGQMFKIFNIDKNDIEFIESSFNIQDFIDKKVDAYSSFLTNEPFILRKQGIAYNVLDPSNYGIELYDVNLFCSKDFAQKNPETVKKFIDASNRGWAYALQNKDTVVELILSKYNTQNKSKEHLLFEAKETERMMLPKVYPIGSIDIKKVQKMGNLFTEVGMTKNFEDFQSIIFEPVEVTANLTKQELNFIEENKIIPISVMQDFSPFSFEINGEYKGFVDDTLSLLEKKTGLKFQRVTGQWVENLERFKSKQSWMIADISHKIEREKFTLFSEPYYEIPTLIFVRDDFKDYKGIESFKGKKVGIQKDIFYAQEVSQIPQIDLVVNESIEEMAKALSYGQIDIAIMNLLTMNHYIKKNGLVNIRAIDELVLPTVSREDLRFGVNLDQPLLFSIVQKGLGAITYEEWMQLTNKWIGLNSKELFIDQMPSNQKDQPKASFLNAQETKYLEEKKQIKMCVAPNWMPLEAIDPNGNHTGVGLDIKNIIQTKLGKNFILEPTSSWNQSLEKMKNKECDILSFAKNTPNRQEYMNFTHNIFRIPYVIAAKKEKFFIDSFEEIKEQKFAVVKGYATEEELKSLYPQTQLVLVNNVKEGLQLVQKGAVYGFIDATAVIGYAIDENEMHDLKIIGKMDRGYDLSYGVRKDDIQLLQILNKAILNISEADKNRIYRKWIAIEQQKVIDYSLLWKIILTALIFALFMTYWNSKLLKAKKEIEKTNQLLSNAKNEIEKKNEALRISAITDRLTGIYNRAKLDDLLQEEINRCERFDQTFSFCILDIDYFKEVNDNFGHQIGDKLLIQIATFLKENTRKTDFVGRWGGEEFVLILPQTDQEIALSVIEKIRSKIAVHEFETVGKKTASFGMATYQKDDDIEKVLKRADDALYEAKNGGRNKICTA